MCSTKDYETEVLECLINCSITNCSCDKLDGVLVHENEKHQSMHLSTPTISRIQYRCKVCSDHLAIKIKFETPQSVPTIEFETPGYKLA